MAKRSIASILIIADYAKSRGVSVESLLETARIDAEILKDPQAEVDDGDELAMLGALLEQLGDPFQIGVELGSRYQLTSYGIVGYALLSSSTMRKAATLGIRYLGLTYAFSDIVLDESSEQGVLSFKCDTTGSLGTLLLIRDIWAVSVIQRELFVGNNTQLHLKLKCSLPDYCKRIGKDVLEQQLGGTIEFDQGVDGFVQLASVLDQPLVKGNDLTARICEAQCAELLRQKQRWPMVSTQVRDMILRHGLDVSMESIAQYMARSSRTLHRQLKGEGTNWRKLKGDVRMGLAEELLHEPVQMDEIAERLGYSDVTNFSHSFKRCKGVSPSQFRKQFMGE